MFGFDKIYVAMHKFCSRFLSERFEEADTFVKSGVTKSRISLDGKMEYIGTRPSHPPYCPVEDLSYNSLFIMLTYLCFLLDNCIICVPTISIKPLLHVYV